MSRRLGPGLLALVVVLLLLAGCGGGSSADGSGSPPSSGGSGSFQPTHADFRELRALLARRASAVLHHRASAFMSTVDRRQPTLMHQQRTIFANMTQLPLSSLTYAMDSSSLLVPAPVGDGDPVLRPALVEQLQIRGTMPAPVSNALDQTFVRRDGHWYLGAEIAPSEGSSGQTADERPWYGVPIVSRSDGPLTVLVDRSRAATVGTLLREVSDGIDVDASLLGVPAQHAILVDATSNGTSTSFSTLSKEQAGAVTFGLAHTNAAGDRYVGSAGLAIKINPHEVSRLAESKPLLRHELTHFLLHEYLGSSPRWLSEGVANWVEFYPDDYPALRLTGDLYTRTLHSDRELPTVGVFNYDPDIHYQVAQAAVAWLVKNYGMSRLLDLMRAYRDHYQDVNVDALTPRMLQETYGITEKQLVDGAFGLIATFQH
jgi:hypothetical protein